MRITVGMGSCGIAAGAADLYQTLLSTSDVPVTVTGCIGLCYLEPIVNVIQDDQMKIFIKVTDTVLEEILKYTRGEENHAMDSLISSEDEQRLASQHRIALINCGLINPENLEDYLAKQGYEAIRTCIETLSPDEVINIIKTSGLSGRGGAGFPTWFKWNAAKSSPDGKKYVICNADEGDPGAFMDRAIMEGDPHALLEGMMIAAYAMGSDEGIIYVRAEYPLAIERLEKAIAEAKQAGFLGQSIFGSSFAFKIRIKAGAGAFVCGEETALIASLEGERGMPRLKPPFPAQKGYWAQPSNINNVETYANVPWIIRQGGEAFAVLGTESAKGTKVFALTGKIANGGLVEVTMGKTINDVIYGPGGGIKDGKQLKAVQMGGPSGGCIPADLCDTTIEYKTLMATGAIMGSGGMVVMDESTCMVDMARFFLDFTCKESCGKCVPCRIGNKRLLEILERICAGEGREGDLELLEHLSGQIKESSLCGLGMTAPNPVLTTLRYFKNEYEDHILHKKCTAHQCKALITYRIRVEQCIGCTLCAKKCPTEAITGAVKQVHTIDTDKCTKCNMCFEVCKFNAVEID